MNTSVNRDEVRLVDGLGDAGRGEFGLRPGCKTGNREKCDKKKKGIPKKESASLFHKPPTLQIWCVIPGIAIGPRGLNITRERIPLLECCCFGRVSDRKRILPSNRLRGYHKRFAALPTSCCDFRVSGTTSYLFDHHPGGFRKFTRIRVPNDLTVSACVLF